MADHKQIAEHSLPLADREALCRALLAEFGVTRVHHEQPRHELQHRCALPWHDERRPSASINYQTLTYRCYSCDSKGGLYWFIASCRQSSSADARHWLETHSGGGPEGMGLTDLLTRLDAIFNTDDGRSAPIPKFSSRVLDPWRFIHPYLTDTERPCRGIPEQNVIDLQIGWNPETDRIVFPAYWKGDLVGWQTRRISKSDPIRWQMSPDFPRERVIYNYDPVRRTAFVVESMMSVAKHLHHLPIEATFGAAVTDAQVRALAQHENIVLGIDPDPAGWRWALGTAEGKGRYRTKIPGLAERLAPYSNVRVTTSPWTGDFADYDDDTAYGLFETAVPWTSWQMPEALTCWWCKSVHEGVCEMGAAAA